MRRLTSFFDQLRRRGSSLRESRLARETGWLVSAKLVQGISSVLATMVVARHLGPGVFGQLSIAVATASLVATSAALGLESIATRELSLPSQLAARSSVVSTLRRLRALGAGLGTLLLLIMALTPIAEKHAISALLLVLCLLPIAQVGDLHEWRLIAAGKSKVVALIAVLVSPAAALVRLGLAIAGSGVFAFAWILVFEWVARSMLLAIAGRALSQADSIADQDFAPRAMGLLRESMPLLLAGIAVFVYMRIDQFMIAGMLDPRSVGLYSAIVTLSEVPLVLPVLLLRAALPTLTTQAAEDPDAMNRTFVRLLRFCFYLHAAGAVIASISAEFIVEILFGSSYRDASFAFRILVLGAPFVALGVISSAWLVINRCTKHAFHRTILGALTNIGLNFALIPAYGIGGAAMATVAAFAVASLLADLLYPQSRELFWLKLYAMTGWKRRQPL